MTTTEQAPAQAGIGGEELEKLKQLAEAAKADEGVESPHWYRTVELGSVEFHSSRELIAACSPDVVLALVSRLAELERDRETIEQRLTFARQQLSRIAAADLDVPFMVPEAQHFRRVATDGIALANAATKVLNIVAPLAAATPEGR